MLFALCEMCGELLRKPSWSCYIGRIYGKRGDPDHTMVTCRTRSRAGSGTGLGSGWWQQRALSGCLAQRPSHGRLRHGAAPGADAAPSAGSTGRRQRRLARRSSTTGSCHVGAVRRSAPGLMHQAGGRSGMRAHKGGQGPEEMTALKACSEGQHPQSSIAGNIRGGHTRNSSL